jgi:hypothetical protein
MDSLQIAIEGPRRILTESGFDFPEGEMDRYALLCALAVDARHGRIVELGAGKGLDCVALSFGSMGKLRPHIHAIDWCEDCQGFDGEQYFREDVKIFDRNTEKLKPSPTLHVASFKKAAEMWNYPVALLIWDGNVLQPDGDVAEWERFVVPGGLIALIDTDDGDFKCVTLAGLYVKSGWYSQIYELATPTKNISVLVKKMKEKG